VVAVMMTGNGYGSRLFFWKGKKRKREEDGE
jgi:hypothetical protein